MRGCHKDGVPTDPVHVDTGACLYVVQVDVTILGDQVDHIIFGTNLNTGDKDDRLQPNHICSLLTTHRVETCQGNGKIVCM